MSTLLRQRAREDLRLAGLAEGTQTAYLRVVRQLAAPFRKAPDQLTEQRIREYLLYLRNERRSSPSTLKIAASGIFFFYSHTAPRDWQTLKKLRFPRPQSLPDVLTIDKVRRLGEEKPIRLSCAQGSTHVGSWKEKGHATRPVPRASRGLVSHPPPFLTACMTNHPLMPGSAGRADRGSIGGFVLSS